MMITQTFMSVVTTLFTWNHSSIPFFIHFASCDCLLDGEICLSLVANASLFVKQRHSHLLFAVLMKKGICECWIALLCWVILRETDFVFCFISLFLFLLRFFHQSSFHSPDPLLSCYCYWYVVCLVLSASYVCRPDNVVVPDFVSNAFSHFPLHAFSNEEEKWMKLMRSKWLSIARSNSKNHNKIVKKRNKNVRGVLIITISS